MLFTVERNVLVSFTEQENGKLKINKRTLEYRRLPWKP